MTLEDTLTLERLRTTRHVLSVDLSDYRINQLYTQLIIIKLTMRSIQGQEQNQFSVKPPLARGNSEKA